MRLRYLALLCATSTLVSCGTNQIEMSDKHMQRPADTVETKTAIPEPVMGGVVLPPPKPATKVETYSVIVENLPAQEILFALAQDAKINLDIHTGIRGSVTINAINQTLPQILTRIAKQVDMRYEIENGTLTVMPDTPFLHIYKIDYMNMSRESQSTITNSTQITSEGSNNSSLTIKNLSKNDFWKTLTQNIKDLLHETDKVFLKNQTNFTEPAKTKASTTSESGTKLVDNISGSASTQKSRNNENPLFTYREAASVIANPENGIISVRATAKQHESIQRFIDQVMTSARRQVMIEATIVEVNLSDNYQQGIDWSSVRTGNVGFNLTQASTGGLPAASSGSLLTLGYLNPTSNLGSLAASISLLESFGKVKVLSSPKLSVLNNQTAMLRVVDNNVYFTVNSTIEPCSPEPCTPIISYTTIVTTVPIGFTMSLTPQINDNDTVLLNIRPSITRLLGDALDPTPALLVPNRVPQTSTREMESVLKIENKQIAVLGGLMEDKLSKQTDEVPFLAKIPLLGNFFQHRNDTTTKTELVIFLRPVVLKNASIDGDFKDFRSSMPDANFFKESSPTQF